jgi:hypothetical protein
MIDYIAAAVGIVIVFIGGVFIFGGMLTNGVANLEQKNSIMQAQSLFDYILLTPGYPSNWGSNSSLTAPKAFGLANAQATQPYTLSQADVMRLLVSSSQFQKNAIQIGGKTYLNLTEGLFSILVPVGKTINYTYVKKVLGIYGSYEFYLSLTPALNVSVHPVSTSQGVKFSVKVTNFFGAPLPLATLTGSLIYLSQTSQGGCPNKNGANCPSLIYYSTATATTNLSGVGILSFNTQVQPQSYALIVQASSSNLIGYGYYSSVTPSHLEAYALLQPGSDNVTLIQHCAVVTTAPCGVDYFNVSNLIQNNSGGFSIINLTCTRYWINGGKGVGNVHSNSTCSGLLYNGFLLVSIKQTGNGQQSNTILEIFPLNVAFANLFVNFGLNPVSTHAISVTTLTRVVVISGVSYIATFAYWPDQAQAYGGLS